MKVTVLLFAHHRELAATGSVDLELPGRATVRDAISVLRARPGLGTLPAAPLVAVNQQYASLERTLRSGDEVAIIPPVAGG